MTQCIVFGDLAPTRYARTLAECSSTPYNCCVATAENIEPVGRATRSGQWRNAPSIRKCIPGNCGICAPTRRVDFRRRGSTGPARLGWLRRSASNRPRSTYPIRNRKICKRRTYGIARGIRAASARNLAATHMQDEQLSRNWNQKRN